MTGIFTQYQALLLLAFYGVLMVSVTLFVSRRKRKHTEEFLLSERNVGVLSGALSIAAAWIWAPALFVASQKAFEQGVAGLFWFVFPNVLALLVFAPLALRIRSKLPNGYTFPEYIRLRHGRRVHVLYMIQFLVLQLCSFAVQILAGATLVSTVSGLPYLTVALILVGIVLSYALLGGLRASIATDVVQMVLIFLAIALVVPWAVSVGGGWHSVVAGIGGIKGTFTNIFDPWVMYSFGIATTIGLLSGPIGDQMHWQRAFAMKNDSDVVKTFVLAAIIFGCVPLSLSLLGFLAAGKVIAGTATIASAQMVGPLIVAQLLPHALLAIFVVMLLAGLCSTLDSILCATSALAIVDMDIVSDGSVHTEACKLRRGRTHMVLMAFIGLAIALIPGLKILYLFLFYATLRAATAVPTVLTLYWPRLSSKAVFWAVLSAMVCGAPLMAYGSYVNNVHISVAGSLLTVFLGFTVSVLGTKIARRNDN